MKCSTSQSLTKTERCRNRRPFGRRFFCLRPSWCLEGARYGVLHPCQLCARPGALMVPGVEYCTRANFAPVLVPRWCQVWSIAPVYRCARPGTSMVSGMEYCTRANFAPVLVPRGCQAWSIAPVYRCARPGASRVPGMEYCTRANFAHVLVP